MLGPMGFDTDIAVRRRPGDDSDRAAFDGAVFDGVVSSAWNIGDNPNGGYLMALALEAAGQLVDGHDPLTLTTHFHRPGRPGEQAVIAAEVLKRGRSMSSVRATLTQDGKSRLDLMVGLGSLSPDPASPDPASPEPANDERLITVPPVDLPPPAACVDRRELAQGVTLPILDRLDVRIPERLSVPGDGSTAEMAGWIRFGDGRPVDSRALVLFADAFPPTVFTMFGNIGWVPTLEMAIHVRRRPTAGWIAGHFVCDDLRDGRLIETGTLWDETGSVVARSRQLGLLLTGR